MIDPDPLVRRLRLEQLFGGLDRLTVFRHEIRKFVELLIGNLRGLLVAGIITRMRRFVERCERRTSFLANLLL